jgi:hypothetical protein
MDDLYFAYEPQLDHIDTAYRLDPTEGQCGYEEPAERNGCKGLSRQDKPFQPWLTLSDPAGMAAGLGLPLGAKSLVGDAIGSVLLAVILRFAAAVFGAHTGMRKNWSLLLAGLAILGLDAAVVRGVGPARHAALIAQMQQIAAHLSLAQLIRRAAVVRGKAADALEVDCLGRGRQSGRRHVRDHSLTQLSHRGIPLLESAETSVPAIAEIPLIASPGEACSHYGEAVQSKTHYAGIRIMPRRSSNLRTGVQRPHGMSA